MCMKPNIANWAYIGLAYLLLINTLDIVNYFTPIKTADGFIYFPLFFPLYFPYSPVIIIIVSTVAVFGLVKKTSWARIATLIIGVQGFLILLQHGSSISTRRTPDSFVILNFIFGVIIPLTFGAFLLLLAYKLYTSEPFKIYLSKPQSKFQE